MKPNNITERKKKWLKYTAWSAASLLLMFILFRALPEMPAAAPAASEIPMRNKLRQYQEVVETDAELHQQLLSLEDMDKQYAAFRGHPGNAFRLDSLGRAIKAAEQLFRDRVDSTIRQHANGDWSDSLVNNMKVFQTELANRQEGTVRTDLLETRGAMLDKDIRIADLEAEVRSLKNTKDNEFNTLASGTEQKGDPVLKADFEELKKNYTVLQETNSRLHKVNDLLSTPASPVDASPSQNTNVAAKKTSTLEHKIADLNAELNFSTVDCNLSRVDVHQIISNSKQRRALLTQAMDILTSLKNSSDPDIHQRAEQKMEMLEKIISTVRD